VARAIEDYSAYVERAPGWDGGNWQQLSGAIHALDEQRRQTALHKLADIHVAACARVGNEQFKGNPLDPELERSLLDVLVRRVGVTPEEIEALIERRESR
jgi:hypothetical protein